MPGKFLVTDTGQRVKLGNGQFANPDTIYIELGPANCCNTYVFTFGDGRTFTLSGGGYPSGTDSWTDDGISGFFGVMGLGHVNITTPDGPPAGYTWVYNVCCYPCCPPTEIVAWVRTTGDATLASISMSDCAP